MKVFIALISWLVITSAQTTPKPSLISGVEFGQMETFSTAEGMVYHLEDDLSRQGYVMFSDGASLKTTNGKTTFTIAGKADSTGYFEGIGGSARFGWITGFTQINETHVLVVDYSNHCLRIIDRTKNLSSRFVGQCTTPGFQNGLEAFFHNPWSVVKDIRQKKTNGNDHDLLLVTDSKNQAVRFLDFQFKSVFTYLDGKNGLNLPYGITYDPRVANLFTTNFNYVMAHNADDESDIRVTGNFSRGFMDGKLQDAQFGVPAEIISLRDHLMLLADQDNNVLRLLDLKSSVVSSVCIKSNISINIDGNTKACRMDKPRSLLLSKDGFLYIGQLKAIRKIKVKLPANEIPPVLPGTSLSGCPDTNGTFRLRNGETKVRIELLPGYVFSLAAGEHEIVIKEENCTININVEPEFPDRGKQCPPKKIEKTLTAGSNTAEVEIYTGEILVFEEGSYQYRTVNCTTNITINPPASGPTKNITSVCSQTDVVLVAPDGEETAIYIEEIDGVSHAIKLPVGVHETSIDNGEEKCNKNVTVIDYRLKRRLIFTANYKVTCGQLEKDNETTNLVEESADRKFIQIKDLCPRECDQDGPTRVICHPAPGNDTTTISWPTDIIYSGKEKTVPKDDLDSFEENLRNSKNILDVTVLSAMPPVVFPSIVNNRTVAVYLEPFCEDFKTYNATRDACE